MSVNLKVENKIDAEFVDHAEQELYQILLHQRIAFNERWYAKLLTNKSLKVLRLAGLFLSLLALFLCVFLYSRNPGWSSYGIQGEIYIFIFIIFGLVFYYLPLLEQRIKMFTHNMSIRSCNRLARKCVKKARKLVPFTSQYDIKGNLVTYYRCKDDVWKLEWFRRLKGIAICGDYATAIFNKPTSIQPSIIILHQDFTPFESVFNTLHLEFKKVPSC